MNINIPTSQIKAAQDYVKEIADPKDIVKALTTVAARGVDIILKRTAVGKGYKGSFKNYHPDYAKWKREVAKHTRIIPNLELSGDMLRDMHFRQAGKMASEIYFRSPTSAKKAIRNNMTRPFFGFNTSERDKLVKRFHMTYKSIMDKKKAKIAMAGGK